MWRKTSYGSNSDYHHNFDEYHIAKDLFVQFINIARGKEGEDVYFFYCLFGLKICQGGLCLLVAPM